MTDRPDRPQFFRCGCCGHYHHVNFWGDCRDNENRFTEEDLEEKYGLEGVGWDEAWDDDYESSVKETK